MEIGKNKLGLKIDTAIADDLLQLVSFNIDDEEFGLDILRVQEINRMVDFTRVPNSPDFVEGVINLRGKVIPIIDLRKRLNMPPRISNNETRIIVVDVQSKVIGFIVDRVNEVLRIHRSITEPPPPTISGINSDLILSIGKLDGRLLILLNLDKIVANNIEEVVE